MNGVVLKPCRVILEPCTPKAQLTLSAELRNVINERNILTTKTKNKFISALNEINDDSEEKSSKKKMKEQAIQEIFQTEVNYLKQLELIMDYFMEPIKEKDILSSEDFKAVFGDIAGIYDVNGALLKELKRDSSKVAEAFCRLAPFFKLYSVYAYNYTSAMSTLQELIVHNAAFSKFLNNQESRPEVQSKLTSLLITPIQRVPRYLLLLKQVFENTSPVDSDYRTLKVCIEQLERTTDHINKQLDERESSQRLVELQKSLVQNKPTLIQANRKLICEGTLVKVYPQDPRHKEFYMVLLSDILLWCKMKKSNINSANSLKCAAILPLHKLKVKFHPDTRYIRILYENEEFIFYHKNENENEQWFESISEAIKKETDNRQTLRKNSSARKAVFKKDVVNYHNPGISPDKTRRKRQYSEQPRSSAVGQEGSSGSSDPFSRMILKRKPIRSSCGRDYEPPSKRASLFNNTHNRDVLFPLREATGQAENEEEEEWNDGNKEIFVFGNPSLQQNHGFRFQLGNVLTGLGQSIKRFFSWK